jgi:hypothetical protein
VYIDYSVEEVICRWDHKAEEIYAKFHDEDEKLDPVPHANRLVNKALLSGRGLPKKSI